MANIVLSPVTCPALTYFSTVSHKWHDIWQKSYWTQNVFWFFLQILSKRVLIIRTLQRDTTTNAYKILMQVPLILVRFQTNVNSLDRFSKIPQISKLIKIRPVGAELLHADMYTDILRERERDRQSHVTTLIVAFRNFVNARDACHAVHNE
jgi:hypothetical protein